MSQIPSHLFERYNVLVNEADELKESSPRNAVEIDKRREKFQAWRANVSGWLTAAFPNSTLHGGWVAIDTPPAVSYLGYRKPDYRVEAAFKENMKERIGWLTGAINKQQQSTSSRQGTTIQPSNRNVFLIHGRDDGAVQTVARFLEKDCGLVAIVLHEQPDTGKTIIEKFEAYSNVAFAVALLTPDDIGCLRDAPKTNLNPRARQNVILELGFFIGALGRERVRCLHKECVEIPSNLDGVLRVPFDDHGVWRQKLAKELEAAGLPPKPRVTG